MLTVFTRFFDQKHDRLLSHRLEVGILLMHFAYPFHKIVQR